MDISVPTIRIIKFTGSDRNFLGFYTAMHWRQSRKMSHLRSFKLQFMADFEVIHVLNLNIPLTFPLSNSLRFLELSIDGEYYEDSPFTFEYVSNNLIGLK